MLVCRVEGQHTKSHHSNAVLTLPDNQDVEKVRLRVRLQT